MKAIVIIGIMLMLGCSGNSTKPTAVQDDKKYSEVVVKPDTAALMSLSFTKPASKCDSMQTELFLANYKIEKVRFYLNIVIHNPDQVKYLKGWIIRALK